METSLILPGDPLFDYTLGTAPPPDLVGNDETGMIYVMGLDGLPRTVSSDRELDDYLLGGEYEEVMAAQDDDDDLEIFELYL